MPSAKGKKSKNKLLRIDVGSSSDSDESEHELSYYAKDKVKLMKEVLKLIKPKKIKSMAPECIKNLDIVEINSMLLEELLGISNKRLQYIFNGENVDRETSSSESEEEKQPIDIISLDDISDDDIEFCISEQEKNSLEGASKKGKKHKSHKIKVEPGVSVKSEKESKKKSSKSSESKSTEDLKENDKDKLMSVLELLELQARARAIRSQLAIENEKKKSESEQNACIKVEEESDSDVIIESPKNKEIVITSSDSEDESEAQIQQTDTNAESPQKKQKLTNEDITEYNVQGDTACTTQCIKEVIDVEVTNKQTTPANTDSDKRKQKLMAKVQKVRLKRNRSKGNGKDNTIKDTAKCKDSSLDNSVTSVTVNEEYPEKDNTSSSNKELEASLSDSKAELEKSCDLTKIEKTDETPNSNKEKQETAGVGGSANNSYCDNDEIVINLDEDEMDGIEND